MKNLATCKPSEFLRQTNRIKKAAEKWLTDTDIMNIRKRLPDLLEIKQDMGQAEIDKVVEENKKRTAEQAMKNFSAIYDAISEDHPDETVELLGLLCFIEPEDADNHSMSEYFNAVTEMVQDEAVIGFFTSLARLGLTFTPTV